MVKLVPDALVEKVAIIEKRSSLAAAIRKRYDGILDRVSLYAPIRTDEPEDRWRDFVRAFRAA
jgi:hypothetical protein